MRAFKIVVEYDGTDYAGWQYQTNATTIQGELERNLSLLCREPIRIHGSGRTDAGVHAIGQVAHFHTEAEISAERIRRSLNGMLNNDISVLTVEAVDLSFHARRSARGKHYVYRILNRKSPSAYLQRQVWHVPKPLERARMEAAMAAIEGEHDFQAFCCAKHTARSTVRTVSRAEIVDDGPHQMHFHFEGTGFLRYMVRSLVGSVVDVGLGRLKLEDFKTLFQSKRRAGAGRTAPAKGLLLYEVFYPPLDDLLDSEMGLKKEGRV